jgi:hypothetical protein
MPVLETVEAQVEQMSLSIRKLSMIGAALKIRKDAAVDSRTSGLIPSSVKSMLGEDVDALDDRDVWLPTKFIKRSVVEAALDRIAAASLKDAYLVTGRYTMSTDPHAAAFVTLRTLRSGVDPIAQSEMEDMLRDRGFVDIESDVLPLTTYTLGRHPWVKRHRPPTTQIH